MNGRLMDPRRPDGTFPFEFTDRAKQDVRATWDRLCPGWRERKAQTETVVRSIKPRVRAKT
jgi:hypothetical protein